MNSDLALNPFKKGKKTEVEGVKKVEVSKNQLLYAIRLHEKIFHENDKEAIEYMEDLVLNVPVLEPKQIDEFVKYVAKNNCQQSCFIEGDVTNYYIDHLIQESFNAGHNDFVINTHKETSWGDIFNALKGKENNLLSLKINGDLGDNSLKELEYCSIELNGHLGPESGEYINNSKFILNGHTFGNYDLGGNSKNSDFIVNGEMGSIGRYSNDCRFVVKQDIAEDCGEYSNNCIFIAYANIGKSCGTYADKGKFFFRDFEEEVFARGSTNSIYCTDDPELYKKIKEKMIIKLSSNSTKLFKKGEFDLEDLWK